jgi:hypothetical protein
VDESELEAELAGLEDEWAEEEKQTGLADRAPSYLVPSQSHELPSAPTGLPQMGTKRNANAVDEFGLPLAS